MYQMNNRVVANGTPLGPGIRQPRLRGAARRATTPRSLATPIRVSIPHRPTAPTIRDSSYYDGILPGFSVGLYLPESQAGWVQYLRQEGYDVPSDWRGLLRG